MLSHDLRSGLWRQRGLLLISLGVALYASLIIYRVMNNVAAITGGTFSLTMGELLFYLLIGSLPATPGEPLDIPAIWLFFQVGCLLFTLNHPVNDLEQSGTQILLRSGSRLKWWLCKCVWNVLCVLLYNAAAWAMMAVFCAVLRLPLTLEVRAEFAFDLLPSADIEDLSVVYSTQEMLFQLVLVPLLAMLAMNLLQMFNTFFLSQILGFVVSITLLIVSLFQCAPWAIGNFGMMQRNSTFFAEGLDFGTAPPILLGVCLCAVVAGCVLLRKKDILSVHIGG